MKRMLARSAVWHTSYRSRLHVWNAMNMASQAAMLEDLEVSEVNEKNTMRWQRWQAHETMVLIAAKKQQALRSVESIDVTAIKLKKTRNKWKEIEAICREKGIDRSAQQCQARWFRLTSAFTQIRGWEDTRQPEQPSFWSLTVDERKTMGFLPSLDRKTYDAMVELYNRKVDDMEDASIKAKGKLLLHPQCYSSFKVFLQHRLPAYADEEEMARHEIKKHLLRVYDENNFKVNKKEFNCSAVQGCTSEGEGTHMEDFGNTESVHKATRAELLEVGVKELELAITEDTWSMNSGNESIEDRSQEITCCCNAGEFRHAGFTPEWECTIKEDSGSVESVHQVHEAERAKVSGIADKEWESTFKDDRGSLVKLRNGGLEDRKQEMCTSGKAGALWHAGCTSKQESSKRGDFWIDKSVHIANTAEILDAAAKDLDFKIKDGIGTEMKSGIANLEDPSWDINTSSQVSDFQHAGSMSEQDSTFKGSFWSSEIVHEARRGKLSEVAGELNYTLKDDKGSRVIENESREITTRSRAGVFQHAGFTLVTIKGDYASVENVPKVETAEALGVATKEVEFTIKDDRGALARSGTGCIEDLRGEINISIKGGEPQPAGFTYEQESTMKGDCGRVENVQYPKIIEVLEVAAKEPEVTIIDERGSPMKAGTDCKEDQSRALVSSSKTDENVSLAVQGAVGNVLRYAMQTVRKFFNL